MLNLAKRAREIFESSEVEEKKQLLNFVLQNLQLKEKELVFTVREPFNTMLKFNNCPTMLPLVNAFRTLDWGKVRKEIYLWPLKYSYWP